MSVSKKKKIINLVMKSTKKHIRYLSPWAFSVEDGGPLYEVLLLGLNVRVVSVKRLLGCSLNYAILPIVLTWTRYADRGKVKKLIGKGSGSNSILRILRKKH